MCWGKILHDSEIVPTIAIRRSFLLSRFGDRSYYRDSEIVPTIAIRRSFLLSRFGDRSYYRDSEIAPTIAIRRSLLPFWFALLSDFW